jgi:hypothetical protein
MQTRACLLPLVAIALFSACAPTQAQTASTEPQPRRELHLPPVGPSVFVKLDGKGTDVVLATLPHEGTAASLLQLWRAAFPSEDAAPLHFDLIGSDDFHPASRAKCTRLLTGAEIATAHIDIVTHNVSFDEGVNLPGCYRVKAVVTMDVLR